MVINMDFEDLVEKIEEHKQQKPTYWGAGLAGEVGEIAEVLEWSMKDPRLLLHLTRHSGKANNILKKYERDIMPHLPLNPDVQKRHVNLAVQLSDFVGKLRSELAGVFIYTVLIANRFDIDLQRAVLDELNIIKLKQQKECENTVIKEETEEDL